MERFRRYSHNNSSSVRKEKEDTIMLKKEDLTHERSHLVIQLQPDEGGVLRVAGVQATHLYKDATVVIPEYYQLQAPPLAFPEEIQLTQAAVDAIEAIDWDGESNKAKDGVVADLMARQSGAPAPQKSLRTVAVKK